MSHIDLLLNKELLYTAQPIYDRERYYQIDIAPVAEKYGSLMLKTLHALGGGGCSSTCHLATCNKEYKAEQRLPKALHRASKLEVIISNHTS